MDKLAIIVPLVLLNMVVIIGLDGPFSLLKMHASTN